MIAVELLFSPIFILTLVVTPMIVLLRWVYFG